MDSLSLQHSVAAQTVTDVYTDLQGLQGLKNSTDKAQALRKVAEQFESLFVSMMLKSMRQANDVFSEGNMFDSNESRFYRDMYDQQLAVNIASGQGLGIADALYRQLSPEKNLKPKVNIESLSSTATPCKIEPKENTSNVTENPINLKETGRLNSDIEPKQSRSSSSSVLQAHAVSFLDKVDAYFQKGGQALGVDSDLLIAQSALETGWGKSIVANEQGGSSFNMFNIKADQAWAGDKTTHSTLEFLGSEFKNVNADFRSYKNMAASIDDYVNFIQASPRYQKALENVDNAVGYVKSIHDAGYATDPNYSDKVLDIYQRIKRWRAEQQAEVSNFDLAAAPLSSLLNSTGVGHE